jgi:predicted nicotinamide N-methyase
MAAEAEDFPGLGDLFISRSYETRLFSFGAGAVGEAAERPTGAGCGSGEAAVARTVRIDADAQSSSPPPLLQVRVEQPLDCLVAASTDFDLTGQIVWPAARLLCWYLARFGEEELSGRPCLELGAGCGLGGLVATHFSPDVTLTDNEPEVLAVLEQNVRHASKSCGAVRVADVSWGREADLLALEGVSGRRTWPVLLGADVVYWSEAVTPLFAAVAAMLERPRGVFLLSYFDRLASNRDLVEAAAAAQGLTWTRVDPAAFVPEGAATTVFGGHLHKMTLYRFVWGQAGEDGGGEGGPR